MNSSNFDDIPIKGKQITMDNDDDIEPPKVDYDMSYFQEGEDDLSNLAPPPPSRQMMNSPIQGDSQNSQKSFTQPKTNNIIDDQTLPTRTKVKNPSSKTKKSPRITKKSKTATRTNNHNLENMPPEVFPQGQEEDIQIKQGEYNLDNLPPDAFPPGYEEETSLKPGEYNLDNFPPDAFPPGSEGEISHPKSGEYDLDNLPPDAFPSGMNKDITVGSKSNTSNIDDIPITTNLQSNANMYAVKDEDKVEPKILNLPLGERKEITDCDPNFGLTLPPREQAVSEYETFVGSLITDLKNKGNYKLRINGLNSIQDKLEKESNLDSLADPIFYGLGVAPGWNEKNASVCSIMIDIIRHVVVKSPSIKKSTCSIVFPFLMDKIGELRFKKPISGLLEIMAEAICPEFVITQIIYNIENKKAPKLLSTALHEAADISSLFGVGSIPINDLVQKLKPFLQHRDAELKESSTQIICYIKKSFGDSFISMLNDLPDNVKSRVMKELEKSDELPDPTKTYYHRSSTSSTFKPIPVVGTKIASGNAIKEAIDLVKASKKWEDQRTFLDTVETETKKAKNVSSADLGPIIDILKDFLKQENKNLIMRVLTLIELLVSSSDSNITRFIPALSVPIVLIWNDSKPKLREQTTKTINAFLKHSPPGPFVKAMTSVASKYTQDCRPIVLDWVQKNISAMTTQDMERLVPFTVSCLVDKISTTRQSAVQIGLIIKQNAPTALAEAIKNMPTAIQRDLTSLFETGNKAVKEVPVKTTKEPKEEKAKAFSRNKPTKETVEKEQPVVSEASKECPKFVTLPTQAKKNKRLKQLAPKTGVGLLSNRQNLQPFSEKVKYESQTILPSSFHNKLFSNMFNEQIDVLQDMTGFLQGNETQFYMCSDIFARWLVTRCFDKNMKVVTEGIIFLMSLYNEQNLVTLQEMECLVPIIFWFIDSKPPQISDAALDLLFVIRIHSDPSEYSFVLRSCLESASVACMSHIFSEIQFTITDGPGNTELFLELMEYANSQELEIAAACGGVLSVICHHMLEDEKNQLFTSLTDEQINYLSPFIPIDMNVEVNFEQYIELDQIGKSKLLRQLITTFGTNPSAIQQQATTVAEMLSTELTQKEVNMSIIRSVLYALNEISSRYQLPIYQQQNVLQSICFFANRFQSKIAILDGMSQMVNCIIFKLLEKLPAIQAYAALLTGMQTLKVDIPIDSFYAKVWTVVSSRILETTTQEEQAQLVEYLKNQESKSSFSEKDVRPRLIHAVLAIITQRLQANVTLVSMRSNDRLQTAPTTSNSIASTAGKKEMDRSNVLKPKQSINQSKATSDVGDKNRKRLTTAAERLAARENARKAEQPQNDVLKISASPKKSGAQMTVTQSPRGLYPPPSSPQKSPPSTPPRSSQPSTTTTPVRSSMNLSSSFVAGEDSRSNSKSYVISPMKQRSRNVAEDYHPRPVEEIRESRKLSRSSATSSTDRLINARKSASRSEYSTASRKSSVSREFSNSRSSISSISNLNSNGNSRGSRAKDEKRPSITRDGPRISVTRDGPRVSTSRDSISQEKPPRQSLVERQPRDRSAGRLSASRDSIARESVSSTIKEEEPAQEQKQKNIRDRLSLLKKRWNK